MVSFKLSTIRGNIVRLGIFVALVLMAGPAFAQSSGSLGGLSAQPLPPAHRPRPPVYVDGTNPDARRSPMPEGRGMNHPGRGTGGQSDYGRSNSAPRPYDQPSVYNTPSYGVPYGAPRVEEFNLSPGAGPRQGYYQNSEGYVETPDFNAPEPRVE